MLRWMKTYVGFRIQMIKEQKVTATAGQVEKRYDNIEDNFFF